MYAPFSFVRPAAVTLMMIVLGAGCANTATDNGSNTNGNSTSTPPVATTSTIMITFQGENTQNKCTETKKTTTYKIFRGNTEIATVNAPCATTEAKVVKANDMHAYFTIIPTGIGGYIPYGEHFSMYYLSTTSTKPDALFENTVVDADFSSDLGKAVYNNKWSIVVFDAATKSKKSYPAPLTVAQAQQQSAHLGSFKFSPDAMKIAYAVGYGPENERGAVYVLDLTTGVSTKYKDITGRIPYVDGWIDNTTPNIRD